MYKRLSCRPPESVKKRIGVAPGGAIPAVEPPASRPFDVHRLTGSRLFALVMPANGV